MLRLLGFSKVVCVTACVQPGLMAHLHEGKLSFSITNILNPKPSKGHHGAISRNLHNMKSLFHVQTC